jgi:phosphonate transport system substrate-binding protein
MNRRLAISQGVTLVGLLSVIGKVLAKPTSLKIGVLPHISARTIAHQYAPLQNYLSKTLNIDVSILTTVDWASFFKNTVASQYDLVVAPAHVARIMQVEAGLQPIAAYHPKIKGIFITEKSNNFDSPKLVKTKIIVTTNPASLIAIEGEHWLETAHGMRRGEDYRGLNIRGDDSVGYAVLRGEASAGMMCLQDFELYPDEIKNQLKIVETFTEFPNFSILASPSIGQTTSVSLATRLTAFSTKTADGNLFEHRTGFKIGAPTNPKEMASLGNAARKIRPLLG